MKRNAEDAIETETCTFVFGSIDVEFPEDIGDGSEENPFAHNMGSDDTFLLQAYGAETTESDELDYNAEFVGGDMFATNLIKIDGNASVFSQNSGEYTEKWHFNDVNTHFGNMKDYLIEAWDSPGKFDALSLAYRVNGSVDTGSQPSVTLSTKVYSIGIIQFNQFDNALNSDMYADVSGRNNGPNDVHVTNMFNAVYKYTNNPYLGSGHDPINHPTDIIYHIIEKELNQIDIVDRDSLNQARENSMISKMGFSITDKTNSRKLIESICKNTNLYPRFGNNGEFDFKIIRDSYSDNDIDISIKQKDIIKFSFTRTPIENVITMVNVKYKKDYAKDEYSKDTGYCDAHDFFGNGDNGADVLRYNGDLNNSYEGYDYNLFGLDRLSNVMEFESDFIRTRSQANKLRDFLLMQNCNQHTIIKCTLPLKYIYAEVGDVVHFDKLNNNTKAYGEDYSGDNNNIVSRNGQEIYPYFIITSVTKSSKDIKIECMQLHRLERTFNAGLGSLSRRSEVGLHGLLSQFTLNTEEEKQKNGIYNIINNPEPPRYFHDRGQSYFKFDKTNKVVNETFNVVDKQLKSLKLQEIELTKHKAYGSIKKFSWLTERYIYDNTKTIPSDVSSYVANIRKVCNTICTAIENATTMDEFKKLFEHTYNLKGDRSRVAIIQDWPDDSNVRKYTR